MLREHYTTSHPIFFLKIILSISAVFLITLIITLVIENNNFEKTQYSTLRRKEILPGESSVVNARYHGASKDQQLFSIAAELATELKHEYLHLVNPEASFRLKDGTELALRANKGQYQYERLLLKLSENVSLSCRDYYVYTHVAQIDLRKESVTGDSPIAGHSLIGTLSGQGFQIVNSGNTVILMGQSRVLITQDISARHISHVSKKDVKDHY